MKAKMKTAYRTAFPDGVKIKYLAKDEIVEGKLAERMVAKGKAAELKAGSSKGSKED